MSKTYLAQVEKVTSLVEGVRAHFNLVEEYGITREQLDQMEKLSAEATALNSEVERLRAETSQRIKEANEKLLEVKEVWLPVKNKVKSSFDPLKWQMFGIADKR